MTIFACIIGPKSGIFQFPGKLMNFFSNTTFSYVEKSEKNNGAKIFDLSITVFELFTIEVFSFFLYVSINYLQ